MNKPLFSNSLQHLYCCLFLIVYLLSANSCTQQLPKKVFRLPADLNEVSGLYIENPATFWWHNDGGNPAQLYQTNGKGTVLKKIDFPAFQNKDWEDLTQDEEGNIYIGDFGNNRNRRQDLRIYKYHLLTEKKDSILFEYADQTAFPPPAAQANFDMEAFFWYKDSLHLFSKNRLYLGDYTTKHYQISATNLVPQVVPLKNQLFLNKRVVTAAAISPDGQTVALLTYFYKKIGGFIPYSSASIFLIRDFDGTDFLEGKVYKKRVPYFLFATQLEALDFLDNQTLYIASEKTLHIAPKAKKVRLKTRDFRSQKRIN